MSLNQQSLRVQLQYMRKKHTFIMLPLILLCFFSAITPIFARSSIISPLPLPSEKFVDIDERSCSDSCLKKLYTQGYIFSFLAKFNQTTSDKKLLQYFSEALAELNGVQVREPGSQKYFKIALLIPKQLVGRYSVSIANTVLAYLMARDIEFDFEVFDCIDENIANLESSYSRIIQKNFDFVIAMLSYQGTQNLIEYGNILYPTYIPTINKERFAQDKNIKIPDNLYFGGISYKQQIETIMPLLKNLSILEYADDSQIGKYLSGLFTEYAPNIRHRRSLSNQDASHFIKTLLPTERSYFTNAALMLNTAAPKTGLILSQMDYSQRAPKIYVSTQINFNPIILQLASPASRRNFYVVSSIGTTDAHLIEYAALLNNDLRYDWVSYATSLGVEFGLKMNSRGIKSYFGENIRDKQVEYQNRIYTTNETNFILVE